MLRFTGQPFPASSKPGIAACFNHSSSDVVLALTGPRKVPWEREEAGSHWKPVFSWQQRGCPDGSGLSSAPIKLPAIAASS